ncbi:puratrophin-1-like isoform X2 [Dendronephthya gigantea]|nr:puratrophin-1-like isoform X2 [Dendronephthya gigantea]
MSLETQDEQWKLFLEGSMFEDHFEELEKICQEAYGGHSELFDNEFLRPMCLLLQELRAAAEKFFTTLGKEEEKWLPCYERFVTSVIHLSRLNIPLHKGDFYMHLNFGSPGEIIIKYYNSGEISSLPLAKSEYENIWAHNWTERMSQQMKQRFLFMNCIVTGHASRGLERRPWRYLMAFDTGHKRRDSRDFSEELSPRASSASAFSLFLDLGAKPMSALDVNFEVLHSLVICMPGTRDTRGAPVIFLDAGKPEWQLPDFNSEEIARVCLYFYQIPREKISKLGLSVVVDTRNADDKKKTLQVIGEALIYFEEMRPGSIHIAYILGRKDSYLLMFSANKLKEQLKFQFKLLSSFDDLLPSINLDQIPTTFGGSFNYDHDAWLQFRLKQEPFMAGCRSATKLALAAVDELGIGKCGETVEECQELLEQHERKVTAVFSDSRLSALQMEGEQLVANMKQTDVSDKTPDWQDTMEIVAKLYFKMNQVFSKLDVLCRKRKRELEDYLQLKCFDQEHAKVIEWFDTVGIPYIEKPVELAESYSQAISQHNSLEKFITPAKEFILQAQDLLEDGSSIAQSGCADSISVKEMCKVLKTKLDNFTEKLEARRIALVSCMEFHQMVRQCSNWSIHALKHMALMNMEASNTAQGVASLKDNMEGFLQEFPMWPEDKLNKLNELSGKLPNEELQNQAEKCTSEYKEVEDMFVRRQETLQRAAVRVQIPGTVTNGVSEGSSSTSTSNSTSGVHEEDGELDSDDDEKLDLPEDLTPTKKVDRSDSNDEQQALFYNLKDTNGELDEQSYHELSPKTKEKLKYIVGEMVETERDYVKALEYIIQNYVKEMDSDALPASLRGRKNMVFGNIERLYDFHQRYFSQELERCVERPFQIGGAFLKWERQFFLYALYNKNKPISDELLRDHGSVYFRKRQEQLQDKLDLCSYLIKPVQRIGKYALLLRDMIRVIEIDSPCTTHLRHAQEMVKSQLRHGNDLLAMDSLRECDVNVKEQGRLLRQDDFIVWQSKKKHCRRVFLFEDMVLFSKTRKQASGADIFIYKSSLKTADIGLTESVGESGLRFELWFRRRRNVKDTVILQAKNMEIKTSWVIEITRLLWRQAVRNREYGLAEATTGISVGSQPGEQVPTTRSSMFDESSHFSSTMSMSVISHKYPGPYASPLLNKRRITRRVSTLRRSSHDRNALGENKSSSDLPATHVGATTVHVRKTSADNNSEVHAKPDAKRSKSVPVETTDSGDEQGSFERKGSLRQRLFGPRGRNKIPEFSKASDSGGSSETLTKSNENLDSKNNSASQNAESKNSGNKLTKSRKSKSSSKHKKAAQSGEEANGKDGKSTKRKTFMGRFTSSRPLSVVEVRDNSSKQSAHHRTRSDASVVKKCLDGETEIQSSPTEIVLEGSPSSPGYHTVV